MGLLGNNTLNFLWALQKMIDKVTLEDPATEFLFEKKDQVPLGPRRLCARMGSSRDTARGILSCWGRDRVFCGVCLRPESALDSGGVERPLAGEGTDGLESVAPLSAGPEEGALAVCEASHVRL